MVLPGTGQVNPRKAGIQSWETHVCHTPKSHSSTWPPTVVKLIFVFLTLNLLLNFIKSQMGFGGGRRQ